MTGPFDPDQPLAIHSLTFLDEGDEVTVGRADTNSYAVLPTDGAALLRQLQEGMTPRQGKLWYAERYGEDVDIDEFLAVLDELDLLVKDGEAGTTDQPVRWQRLGRAMFSPLAWFCYAGLIGGAIAAFVVWPQAAPHYQNLFFTQYLVVLELGLFLGQMPLILIHEAFHALAGRRLGLNSSLHIGRRLYFLVFETAMDGLVVMPRRRRYLPILAGMLADAVIFSTLTLIAVAVRLESLTGRVLLALAFATLLRLAWQLYVFLRTDIYFLVVTVLGCVDLHTTAHQMLRNRLNRLLGRRDRLADEANWHPRDRAVARWYSWLMVAGYSFLVLVAVNAMIPAVIRMARIIIDRFHGVQPGTSVADTAVFLGLNVAQFVIVVAVAIRSRRQARAARGPMAEQPAAQPSTA
jgi:hypothetical protein